MERALLQWDDFVEDVFQFERVQDYCWCVVHAGPVEKEGCGRVGFLAQRVSSLLDVGKAFWFGFEGAVGRRRCQLFDFCCSTGISRRI